MATKIIKEKQLRKLFPNQQISEEAIEFIDEHILDILINASDSVKNNTGIKRISKEIAKFIVLPNAIIIVPEDDGDDVE
ncbi:hypothetical protein KAU43_01380 [candidate division WOR-3 bacterium]|nr:hypothetical protein [candidate division WOR-3 bacterium]